MIRAMLTAGAAALALTQAAAAQTPYALLRAGDPGWLPGTSVKSLGEIGRHNGDSHGLSLVVSDGVSDSSYIVGGCCFDVGAQPVVIETTTGGYAQEAFDPDFGGVLPTAYSATVTELSSATSGLDSIWVSDQFPTTHALVALEGQPIPSLPGKRWGALERATLADQPPPVSALAPVWLGDIVDIGSGLVEGRGLFSGAGADVVFKSGDVLPGTGGAIDVPGIRDGYALPWLGLHSVAIIDTTEAPGADEYVVANGQALVLGGALVREGELVPASIGGLPGERWLGFANADVNAKGDLSFSATTDAASGFDEVFVRKGEILLREGDSFDGHTLAGPIERCGVSSLGQPWAIWGVSGGAGVLQALLVGQRIYAVEGQEIDTNGQGGVEPGHVLSDLSSAYLDGFYMVYFLARVDVLGTPSLADDLEVYYGAQTSTGTPFGTGKLNSAGERSFLFSNGTARLSNDDLELALYDLTPGNLGLAFWGKTQAQIPFLNHFLYVQPPITRILPTQSSGTCGEVLVPIPIDASMVGTQRVYQYWGRDPAQPDGTGAELSSGLTVTFYN